ncbi:MAG TPA: capsule assembly Wzi family protein [Gemmatimonadaceae bacterium]|nr:capsule assembly Wzi family protein [Gemmatimonadaceae bacterium]
MKSRALRKSRARTVASFSLLSALVAIGIALPLHPASSQTLGGKAEVFVGSEFESYLRYLQTLGKSKSTVWSIRSLSPSQIDALSPTDTIHPWAHRYDFSDPKPAGFTYEFIRPTVGIIENTSFPFGGNDGIVWAGKGMTAYAQTGVQMRWGPLSATFAPVAFRASNSEFPLMDNGLQGRLSFADGQFPLRIDRPQRFGDGAYSRVDLGESTLRIDGAGMAAGISTASQWWGPAVEYPYVLGNNAGGFPHVFFGTSKPANIGIGTLHGRVEYGYLYQSPFSTMTGKNYFQDLTHLGKVRFTAGLAAVMQIRGAPGLEIGGGRFFHSNTDSTGITAENLRLPFQNPLKSRLKVDTDTAIFGDFRSIVQNQLASVFFRWAPPSSGLEIYGEYGREDFSADFRDLMLEPDHSSTLNVGFRKAWMKGTRMSAFRTEFFNYEAPSSGRTRGEGLIYLHIPLVQGHTYRGQLLGANVGVGSGLAMMMAYERFTPGGKMTFFLSRATQHELSSLAEQYSSGPAFEKPVDVEQSVGTEISRFVGPFDVTGRVVLTSNLNRYFLKDVSNANFALIIRQGF